MNTKKILLVALVSLALLPACEKAFEQPADWSSVAVIQASPVAAASPTDTLEVFMDNQRYNSTGIVYNTNSTYLPVLSGSKTIDIRRGPSTSASNYVNSFSYNFEKGKSYSFFVYDTASTSSSQAKVLRLKDDLSLPAANMAHVRFVHLAPNTPAVDLTLLRTSATPNDSVTISGKSYVGASPNEDGLSPFTAIPRGTYTAKIKTAGTQTVLTSATVTITTGANINEGRIVTIYITGTAKGRPLAIGSFRHY
jgi:hypothetical protein